MAKNNYIQTLQDQKAELHNRIDSTEEMCTELLRYLSSDKFSGADNNYVNATKMFNRVLAIRFNLQAKY